MENVFNDCEPTECVSVPTPRTVVEFVTLDGDSSTDSWNGVNVVGLKETGSSVRIDYLLPNDASAPAAMFALIGGSDLGTIYTHRVDSNNVANLTIRHDIEVVSKWELETLNSDQILSVTYLTESSILWGNQETYEVTTNDSSN